MQKKYFISTLIISTTILLFFGTIYLFSCKIEYAWQWSKIAQYFVDKKYEDVIVYSDGIVTEIDLGDRNSDIHIVGDSNEKTYNVLSDSVNVTLGESVFENQKLGNTVSLDFGVVIKGTGVTIVVSFFSIIFSLIFGCFLSFVYFKKLPCINPILEFSIQVVRGIPIYWQILLGYFLLTTMLDFIIGFFINFYVPRLWVGVIILSINSGTNIAHTFLNEIKSSFSESNGIGSTFLSLFFSCSEKITNEFTNTIKDSSLLSIIAVMELTKNSRMAMIESMNFVEPGIICCIIYIILVNLSLYLFNTLARNVKFFYSRKIA